MNGQEKKGNEQMVQTSTNNVWHKNADTFFPSTTALDTKRLPAAIYRYDVTPDGRWFLTKTAARYVFPYKIYGAHEHIVERVRRAWHGLPSNFGVLLNGLKGTGKTITAQQIVNWAIDEGIMVLNVQSPVPLAMIMDHIEQPMLVLFDEFEKTHDETVHKGVQQQLLSAIDGLSKNEHRRLFLFTTNTKKVNDNLVDRPSRIRYNWEFGRLSTDLIDMLIDDMLDKTLKHFRAEIIDYLNTREVLTIDVVKTVIIECNIFKEAPGEFKDVMNLTERAPSAFKVEIIDEMGMPIEVSNFFRGSMNSWLLGLMSKNGQQMFIDNYVMQARTQNVSSNSGQTITFVEPTENEREWICNVQMETYGTWVGERLRKRAGRFLWLDSQPKGWKVPEWARKYEANVTLTDEESNELEDWIDTSSIYGSSELKKVKVRFTIDNTAYKFSTGFSTSFDV